MYAIYSILILSAFRKIYLKNKNFFKMIHLVNELK